MEHLKEARDYAASLDRETLNLVLALAAEDLTLDYVEELVAMAREMIDGQ